jgi:hypothetical protein
VAGHQVFVGVDTSFGSSNLLFERYSANDWVRDLPSVFLTTAIGEETGPALDVAGSDLALAYLDDRSGTAAVYYLRLSVNGTILAGPTLVSGAEVVTTAPTVAVGGSLGDRALVAWSAGGSVRAAIVRTTDGTTLVAPTTLGAGDWPSAVWDATSGVFGVTYFPVSSGYAQPSFALVTTSASVGSSTTLGFTAYVPNLDLAASAGTFVVLAADGAGNAMLWSFPGAGGGPTASASFRQVIGILDSRPRVTIATDHAWVMWTGGVTARRLADLGPVTGEFNTATVAHTSTRMFFSNGIAYIAQGRSIFRAFCD